MDDDDLLLRLLVVFAPLSLLSLGGGQAIVAEVHAQAVEIQKWMSNQEFANLFAISRAAPGPSTLIVALIGWQTAGLLGALVATFAMYIPSSLLVYGVGSFWHSRRDSMFVTVMERGLTPPAVGLLFAGALSVLEASDPTIFSIIVTIATTVAIYVFRLGPYIVMGVIAVLYFGIALFGASG